MLTLLSLAGCETTRHGRHYDNDYYSGPPARPYYGPAPDWEAPQERDKPRLSDMQKRAFDNCIVLPTHLDRARCRATVMSTVR
ncbi:hypothetical protein DBV14_25070 [Variovorax sp. KBW07]|uniref:hypothetical protein n=1 Tax=Variovorax sp. KBW07 TaxID=2153358 RepID=UPI000F58EC3A|nr:hypothetical protein [Variovorax sp. KBW07]RQO44171.1 hypothetical protein DBV14_25070 [Variovorax sp. KBW07]